MIDRKENLYVQLIKLSTEKMLRSKGCSYILILMEYSRQMFDCSQLRFMQKYTSQEPNDSLMSLLQENNCMESGQPLPERMLQLTETEIFKAIGQHFVYLRHKEKKARERSDLEALNSALEELAALNLYLEEVAIPFSKRNFYYEQLIKDSHAVGQAVRRYLKKVFALDPDLYYQIKNHLSIGLKCIWMDNPYK